MRVSWGIFGFDVQISSLLILVSDFVEFNIRIVLFQDYSTEGRGRSENSIF